MDLSKFSSGVLDGIKTRFGKTQDAPDAYDYTEDFDEFADYGEYAYDEDRDGSYKSSSSQHDGYAAVTTRAAGSGRNGSYPDLVSISDVRRFTSASDSSAGASTVTQTANGRTLIGNTGPAPSSPAATLGAAAEAADASSSAQFKVVAATPKAVVDPVQAQPSASAATASVPSASAQGIPKAQVSVPTYSASRSCVVVRPKTYADAEKVAKTLREGNLVVLCLDQTSDQLTKRILDFSFGAAAALGASVDCLKEKKFVLAVGPGLDDQERRGLQSQGVL